MRTLESLVAFSLRNRAIIAVATLLFIALGVEAVQRLPIDAVPDVTNVQVQIITAAPALSPIEVEQYVSAPVERAMAGIPRLTQVRSISKYGLSVVTLVFSEGTDIYFARTRVLERMREAEQAVPARYGRPEMGPVTTGLGEVFQFVVRGPEKSLMELEELLDWYIGPQLRTVPGIVEVNSFGGENKEYQVIVQPERLRGSGLSLDDVLRALERTNANAGGGYIEKNREQLVIGTSGQVTGLGDIASAVVGSTPDGTPITLANVATVQYGPRLRRGAASMDGRGEVVVGVTLMLLGENSRTVTAAVKAKLAEIQPTLPPGVIIEPFYDRAALVDRTIRTVSRNLAEGAVLVIVVLLLLLGSWRAGLIVASTIPLAMLFALLVMRWTGASGNLMSLGAIDFGLIVDGAVIIVENSVRRLNEAWRAKGGTLSSEERIRIIDEAASEVRGATVYGGIIIAVVYVPILALQGIEGKLFHPMAQTVLFALSGAFLASLTVVPMLCSVFLRPEEGEKDTWLMRFFHRAFTPLLGSALRNRWATLTIGLLLLVGGAALFTRLGAEFVPQLDEGDLLVEVRRLPGVALTESVDMDGRIQRALMDLPEVRHVVSRTGAPEVATDPMGLEQTDTYIVLKPREQWRRGRTKAALAEEISSRLASRVPEAAMAISQPIQMRTNELVAGVRSDVAAQVYGPDLPLLQQLANRIGEVLEKVPGATDVRVEQGAGLTYLRILPDRARLARYGLTVEDVNQLTESMAVGAQAGTVFERDRRFALVVKLAPEAVQNLDRVRALPLRSNTGQVVPLGDVAEVRIEVGPNLVNREALSRRQTVEFNVRGRDSVSTVEAARAAVGRAVQLPPGYRLVWGGQFQNFLSARARLLVVVPVALGLIFFMLWMAFRALRPAFLIFFNIPFAAVGGVLALWVRGIPFSISAGVGFIALFGVAVLNGLVLLTFSHQLEVQGEPPASAIAKAAEVRLRPVLMTALVAALGFVPMALSTAPGSEVQRPLATVVIGGLVSATALTLLLLPVLYSWIARGVPAAAAPSGAPHPVAGT